MGAAGVDGMLRGAKVARRRVLLGLTGVWTIVGGAESKGIPGVRCGNGIMEVRRRALLGLTGVCSKLSADSEGNKEVRRRVEVLGFT